jgi:hypothetical protein
MGQDLLQNWEKKTRDKQKQHRNFLQRADKKQGAQSPACAT